MTYLYLSFLFTRVMWLWVVKNGQNSVYVVVEWPQTKLINQYLCVLGLEIGCSQPVKSDLNKKSFPKHKTIQTFKVDV